MGRVVESRENNPEYWRLRAEERRAVAENLRDPTAKMHMLAAAEGFERLAKMAERETLTAPKPANDQS